MRHSARSTWAGCVRRANIAVRSHQVRRTGRWAPRWRRSPRSTGNDTTRDGRRTGPGEAATRTQRHADQERDHGDRRGAGDRGDDLAGEPIVRRIARSSARRTESRARGRGSPARPDRTAGKIGNFATSRVLQRRASSPTPASPRRHLGSLEERSVHLLEGYFTVTAGRSARAGGSGSLPIELVQQFSGDTLTQTRSEAEIREHRDADDGEVLGRASELSLHVVADRHPEGRAVCRPTAISSSASATALRAS